MKEETKEKLKKQTLEILKRGQKSITLISTLLRRNYYTTVEILDSLEDDGKVDKITINKFTFYESK